MQECVVNVGLLTAATSQKGKKMIPLVSLNGIEGRRYAGREADTNQYTNVGTTPMILLTENSLRQAAIIQNLGPATLSINLPESGGYPLQLLPNGTFQIDNNFPWTGAVYGTYASGTGYVYVWEVSVL